jgi:hypothetical protein
LPDWGVVFYIAGSVLAIGALVGLFLFLRREGA